MTTEVVDDDDIDVAIAGVEVGGSTDDDWMEEEAATTVNAPIRVGEADGDAAGDDEAGKRGEEEAIG